MPPPSANSFWADAWMIGNAALLDPDNLALHLFLPASSRTLEERGWSRSKECNKTQKITQCENFPNPNPENGNRITNSPTDSAPIDYDNLQTPELLLMRDTIMENQKRFAHVPTAERWEATCLKLKSCRKSKSHQETIAAVMNFEQILQRRG